MLESLFNKVGFLRVCDFIKKDSGTDAFLRDLRFFKNNYLKSIIATL